MARYIASSSPSTAQQAASVLAAGHLLGLPTETVYGLAADANNPAAVARIFAAKGRPANHPLIVHVAAQASRVAWQRALSQLSPQVPDMAWPLIDAFWPGPLTLILPRLPEVCHAAAGGQATIGLRCPSHPVAQAVLQAAHGVGVWGVAAPSANRFGRVSPTTAAHVMSEFADTLNDTELLVVDGGDCEVGIESTIVDVCGEWPVLLRPGIVTSEQISAVTGLRVLGVQSHSPQVSGSLASHYAPNAQVHVCAADALLSAISVQGGHGVHAVYASSAVLQGLSPDMPRREMPRDAHACAHDLFSALRALDAINAAHIWVEAPPEGLLWDGVRDRLQRASTPV